MRTAVIGMGGMGSQYARLLAEGRVTGMELLAVTRIRPERLEALKDVLPHDLKIYQSADMLFAAVDAGELVLDAVVIATPQNTHAEIALEAMKRQLHVLCDKPAGIFSRQAREMQEMAEQKGLFLSYIYQQRMYPAHRALKELLGKKQYGKVLRINWVISNWYRPDIYYTAAPWRADPEKSGGGLLMNQCPHNLDLLLWLVGMPDRVQCYCHQGKYHRIAVEDEFSAYMEWNNGCTAVMISSTGEAAGVNRLEITTQQALITLENHAITITSLDRQELWYRTQVEDAFIKPVTSSATKTYEKPKNSADYVEVLQSFADKVQERVPVPVGKADKLSSIEITALAGREQLLLANAMYLSSWERRMVELPEIGSPQELALEQAYENKFKLIR